MTTSHGPASSEIIAAICQGLNEAMAPDLEAVLVTEGWEMYWNGRYPFILVWDHVMKYPNPVARICLDEGRGAPKRNQWGVPIGGDYDHLWLDLINLDGTMGATGRTSAANVYSILDPTAFDRLVDLLKCVDSSMLSQSTLEEP